MTYFFSKESHYHALFIKIQFKYEINTKTILNY